MAAYRRVDDFKSPAGWLPVHRDKLRAQRSVTSMEELYLNLLRFGLDCRSWSESEVNAVMMLCV